MELIPCEGFCLWCGEIVCITSKGKSIRIKKKLDFGGGGSLGNTVLPALRLGVNAVAFSFAVETSFCCGFY